MLRHFDSVVQPTLAAAGARRIVEIGALQGETTIKLLSSLGPEAELHVIDPVPQFDPSEHERRFPGQYHFHRSTSHEVLPGLPAMDAALIDGDHNWYTVYNELKMLEASADEAGEPLPLLFLHDVGWPYGRRDLYYAPERIPEEQRQPYAHKGVRPGVADLIEDGGLSARFAHAEREGGPRNGVMSALEDFLAESGLETRTIFIPAHFGLAVVAEHRRIAAAPKLGPALDRLDDASSRLEQAELAEALRVEQRVRTEALTERLARATDRYLAIVKAALLDEHYLENEVRLDYLQSCAKRGVAPDPLKLRDPRMWLTRELNRRRQQRRVGVPVRALDDRPSYPYTTVGRTGLDHLEDALEATVGSGLSGDLVACGIWRGGPAIFMRAYLEAHGIKAPHVWVADRFASPVADSETARPPKGKARRFESQVADLNHVREGFARFDLFDDRVRFLQGQLEDTLPGAPLGEVALLYLGELDGQGVGAVLESLYERLVPGGIAVIEHYDEPGCREAVEEFRRRHGIEEPVRRGDGSSASLEKPRSAAPVTASRPARPARGHAPLAPTQPQDAVDLSVVVVFHNMRREAERTLHSLTRAYQRDIEDLSYEVIVVENGSDPEERLGEDFVRGFGANFRYLDLAEDATPSPVPALNRGISKTRGRALALMIDGAHVLTPGVLRFGVLGLRTYAPAIVTTHQWYLGPGQQGEAMDTGYDKAYEDRLFERIQWPVDGYRLFEIGNFIGERDWFDGLWESNCLFAPRALLEQVGCFDESFSMPGGGYANLDIFERFGATPGLTVAGMLGEASFHQLHGGTTTNQPDIAERHARLMSYREHYEEMRKRPFRGPGKPRHFVGSVSGPALRTRPRWMTAPAFRQAQRMQDDGIPAEPTAIPEQLQAEFTDAFWRSLAWRDVTWLGYPVSGAPTDLVAYQELISEVRPDWIVELGLNGNGSPEFFASICDLTGKGNVLAVRPPGDEAERREHPRVRYVHGEATDAETRREVFEIVGSGEPNGLLVIPPAPIVEVVAQFKAYAPLVGVGSYAIVEGTIVNGHPVMPSFGPGPSEALQQILKNRRDFAPDHRPERFGLTFNPRGFLRRVE